MCALRMGVQSVHPPIANDAYCIFHLISTKFTQISPSCTKFINPPYFRSIYVSLLNLGFLLPNYFDRDAFTHHALHVLDAPGFAILCVFE